MNGVAPYPYVTAVLVDGEFFVRRQRRLRPKIAPEDVAKDLLTMALAHMMDTNCQQISHLYRILFYDAPPLNKKAHLPISGQPIDFSKTKTYTFRTQLHFELRKTRKVALRLGALRDARRWVMKPDATKDLIKGNRAISNLSDDDFFYDVKQKGVDIRLGLDVASLAYKKLVNRIVLVTGDSDFVPAAKLARREGVEVILDPMWQKVHDHLYEHIDGLWSVITKGGKFRCSESARRKRAKKRRQRDGRFDSNKSQPDTVS